MIRQKDTGYVAMKWVLPRNPPLTVIDGTNRIYSFSAKLHIWMAYIHPDDVGRLLKQKAKVCNCNNGTYKPGFEYANLLDVMLWETGGRDILPDNLEEIQ